MASNIVKVGEAASESAAAAQEVLHASDALSAQAERLQSELQRFLATIDPGGVIFLSPIRF